MTGWRVLSVFGGRELDVAQRMTGEGLEAYCPSFKSITRRRNGHRHMTIEKTRPLFNGYLFARVGSDFRPEPFERGGCRIVVYRRVPLSDAQVDAVRSTAFLVSSVSDRTNVQVGALAEFWRGVLRGERAEVLKIRGRNAVVRLLSSKTVLHTDINELETISRATNEVDRVAI